MLPGINEENLVRARVCEDCGLKYAVFGEHRFCPVCGALPARIVALDALAADQTRIDVLSKVPLQPTPMAASSAAADGVDTKTTAEAH